MRTRTCWCGHNIKRHELMEGKCLVRDCECQQFDVGNVVALPPEEGK